MKDLTRFFNETGQLTVWPKKHADKLLVLEYLAGKFTYGKTYSEKEVNEIIKAWHTFQDWALLRRSLIYSGLVVRDRNGYAYFHTT